jgi:hypothetical protein
MLAQVDGLVEIKGVFGRALAVAVAALVVATLVE